ncbi:modular polyketide synthase [Alloactinosynnema sp. L-07]|uniref:hypothetical protein n=1 Tax=Alloactinosynnema sp. L-07 TaxID=1653480 RepID=UPI00065EF034|nr:hypothetical protein [Alloactinosynnema sp. L-07]CRK57239.1 modular polyketide synthase [Alloactinosynnema sp. L-07]
MTDLDLRPVVVEPERLILAASSPAELGVLLDRPDNGTAPGRTDGVAWLLRELAWGDPARHAVVYTASEW